MLVSHYIIDSILEEWDDPDRVRKQMKKFSERYGKDTEFLSACEKFNEALKEKDSNKTEAVKERLKELRNSRQLEGSGGTQLPFKDRRHLGDSQRGR
ncbi:MAG: hypothetical protein V1921_02950 [Candidatus Altiarchaeota archaeon]